MRAVEYDRYGPPEVLELREVPPPRAGKGTVVVRVAAASVNPKDCFVRKGWFRRITGRRFPRRTCYDFSGWVEEAGPGASGFARGDRVFGMVNGWGGGTCAEYIAVPRDEVCPLPEHMDIVESAAVPLAALTALQALRDIGRIGPESRVCVNGASGGVGSFAVQIAAAMGARVTAVCSAGNAGLCRGLGALRTVDYASERIEDSDERFDVFFDVFGNKPFDLTRGLLAPGGAYVTTVPNPKNLLYRLLTALSRTRARIVIVKSRRRDLETLLDLARRGALRPVIDGIYPMEKIRDAHRHVETKHTRGKIVVTVVA
ncbi:MAG: NAD(P)-dependent alcohol dehydrogenase [Spirochaetes bacterium]|nr:NAD(P)-dependent alcohol dehydrogenase [Spirochaetota bacterium]